MTPLPEGQGTRKYLAPYALGAHQCISSPHPPDPGPYHWAGEVVLRQTEIHHTLGTVELRLPRGQLRQGLWSERVQVWKATERSQSAFSQWKAE